MQAGNSSGGSSKLPSLLGNLREHGVQQVMSTHQRASGNPPVSLSPSSGASPGGDPIFFPPSQISSAGGAHPASSFTRPPFFPNLRSSSSFPVSSLAGSDMVPPGIKASGNSPRHDSQLQQLPLTGISSPGAYSSGEEKQPRSASDFILPLPTSQHLISASDSNSTSLGTPTNAEGISCTSASGGQPQPLPLTPNSPFPPHGRPLLSVFPSRPLLGGHSMPLRTAGPPSGPPPGELQMPPGGRPPFSELQRYPGMPPLGEFQKPPFRPGVSPDGGRPPPGEFQRLPGEFQRPPGEFQRPPGEFQRPPGEFQRPPGEFQRPPGEFQRPPGEFQRPCEFQRPHSEFHQRPPSECQRPPGEFQRPPGEFQRPPGEFQRPPGKFQRPIEEFQRSPGEFQKLSGEFHRPGEFQRPPGEFQKLSGEFQRPSDESQRTTGESQRPSGESQRPPGESQRPGEFQRPPRLSSPSNEIRHSSLSSPGDFQRPLDRPGMSPDARMPPGELHRPPAMEFQRPPAGIPIGPPRGITDTSSGRPPTRPPGAPPGLPPGIIPPGCPPGMLPPGMPPRMLPPGTGGGPRMPNDFRKPPLLGIGGIIRSSGAAEPPRPPMFPGLPPGQLNCPGPPVSRQSPDQSSSLMGGPSDSFPLQQRAPTTGEVPRTTGLPMELWFEHVAADGRIYFSHAQTQKTVWERPLNARVLSSPHTLGQSGPLFTNPNSFRSPQFTPGFPQAPLLPGTPQLVPTRVWVEYQPPDSRAYYYNKVTKQSVWEKPKDFELVMPLPASFNTVPTPSTTTTTTATTTTSSSSTISSITTTSISSATNILTTVQDQPLDSMEVTPTSPGKEEDTVSEVKEEEKEDVKGERELPVHEAAVSGAEGTTGEVSVEEQEKKQNEGEVEGTSASSSESSQHEAQSSSLNSTEANSTSQHEAMPVVVNSPMTAAPTQVPVPIPVPQFSSMLPPAMPMMLPPPMFTPPSLPPLPMVPVPVPIPVKLEPTGPRPIASIPVPATPWSVVWSSDERTFFFNATNRTSLWTIPEELQGNPSVHKILDNPPGGKKRIADILEGPETKRLKMKDSDEDSDVEEMELAGVAGLEKMRLKVANPVEAEELAAQARANKSLEERQREFKAMLLERGVSAFSTWDKELPKFVFDPRYVLLTVKERKICFEAFIRSRTEEERRERKNKLKETRDQFRHLLEGAKLHPKSTFSEFAAKYSKDDRFRALEKMREREQLFNEYLVEMKKTVTKHKDEFKASNKTKAEKVKMDFLNMLEESEAITERTQWKKMKGLFSSDPRYKAVDSSSKREELFGEHIKSLGERDVDRERERHDRIQASLKEREREVQISRSAHEKEWGRERDQLRKMEAKQHFKTLLVDTVRSAQVQWHDVKRMLKRDHRWDLTKLLDHDEKEQLFQDHVLQLREKKRMQFRKLLTDTQGIFLNMSWRKARKLIKEDVRYKNFTDSDHKREVEYDKYQRDKMVTAKNEYRALLKETKILTYKSRDLSRESERHYKDILDILKNDKRFLVLECIAEERADILHTYMDDLHRKGPPPPPTATHPGDRLKRTAPP